METEATSKHAMGVRTVSNSKEFEYMAHNTTRRLGRGAFFWIFAKLGK